MRQAAPDAVLLAHAARHLKAGRPADAVAPLAEAARLQPGNATILHDLGLACLDTGQAADAVAVLRRAVALKPRYTDAHFRLGLALERLGDEAGAILAYDRTTELLPSHTEAWFRAGALVFAMGHREEAAGCFRRAAATGPKTRFGRLGQARALLAVDRDADAERVLRQALALDPGNAMAHDLLGNLLAEAGRFDEARTNFERAIAASPLMAGSYYDLVRCGRITGDDGLAARIEAALGTPGLDSSQRLRIHLARGKVADDLGDYLGAMAAFDAADAERRSVAPFDSGAFDAQVDQLIALFTPERLAQAPASAGDDATPILIIGLPRSGTTLVEQIVSSHPEVAAGGELDFWNQRGAAWHQAGPAGFDSAFLQQAAADYLGVLRGIGGQARVTDKMPFNLLWAGLIHLCLPGAVFLNCRRSAIDTALSIHQTLFSPRLAFPTGGKELVAYIRAAARLADHWRRVLPSGRFLDVDYEALTAAPEPEIRRIVAGCGLAWAESCLHPERNARTIRTPSKWQARQPINTRAVERWRRYEPFLGELRALLDRPT